MIEARCDDREWGGQTVAPLSIIKIDFDRVWPWLRQAVDRWGETHRKWHVWRLIEAERAQLWTTENAAIVTTIATPQMTPNIVSNDRNQCAPISLMPLWMTVPKFIPKN